MPVLDDDDGRLGSVPRAGLGNVERAVGPGVVGAPENELAGVPRDGRARALSVSHRNFESDEGAFS